VPRLAPLVVLLLLALAAPAAAQSPAVGSPAVDEAVASLAADPVYVAADAEPSLSEAEQGSVRSAIRQSGAGPVYVAVVAPDAVNQAGGDPGALLREIATTVRRPGTYVLAAGTELRAASTLLRRGRAGELATAAASERRGDGLAAVLRDLIARVGEERRAARDGGGDSGGGVPGWLLLVLIGVPGGLFALRAFRRGREQRAAYAAELDEVRDTARQDVVALGDDIRALDLDVEMPGVDAATREDYGRALTAYERASQAVDRARDAEDFAAVTEAVEEGRYAIVAAKARLEGRQPPERRPPCFFDPRHGPSVRDVEWAPPGGAPRPVPACAADAVTLEEGRDPAMREVMVGGQPTPYWNASPAYGGWAGGFYGGFGGMGFLPGMLFGTMLGGAMGGFGPDVVVADDGGGFGDFGGGDFGGGDFGDFGGGDFGGGGGDFGGGDF
jgi:hypothetical protein